MLNRQRKTSLMKKIVLGEIYLRGRVTESSWIKSLIIMKDQIILLILNFSRFKKKQLNTEKSKRN